MDESGRQDDTRGESLRRYEEAAVRSEKSAVPAEERDGDAGHAGEENGRHSHEFQDPRRGVISA